MGSRLTADEERVGLIVSVSVGRDRCSKWEWSPSNLGSVLYTSIWNFSCCRIKPSVRWPGLVSA